MRGSLARARKGNGETLVLTGDAGIGKSRLLLEFLSEFKAQGIRIHQVDLEPAEVTHNDKPIARLVRDLLDEDSLGDTDGRAERIAGRLKSLGVRGKHALSAALEILGIAHQDKAWLGIDPPERLRLKITMIADLVRAIGRTQPLILVLEDFHQFFYLAHVIFPKCDSNSRISSACLRFVVCSFKSILPEVSVTFSDFL